MLKGATDFRELIYRTGRTSAEGKPAGAEHLERREEEADVLQQLDNGQRDNSG